MRISTAQIFDAGTRGLQQNQYDLYKVQNQLSTGRRVLTPEDDPVGAAQALVISQSKDLSSQYLKNQDDARSKLGLVEGQLSSVGDLLQNVRERLIQAGNTTLSNSDRSYIAQELEARFSELMGLANAQDGSGNYLFSGYKGATRPFATIAGGATYMGDEGQRLLQVETTRQLPISLSGSEVFQNIKNGNGTFVAETGGALANLGASTANTGTLADAAGTTWTAALANNALWVDSAYPGKVEIRFSDPGTGLEYQLFDVSDPLNPQSMGAATAYTSGNPIQLGYGPTDLGVAVTVTGMPAVGDIISVVPDATSTNGFVAATPSVSNLGTGAVSNVTTTDTPGALWTAGLAAAPWSTPANAGDIRVEFSKNATTGATEYQLYDVSDPANPRAMLQNPATYVDGQDIALSYYDNITDPLNPVTVSLGASIAVTGRPEAGDTYEITPDPNPLPSAASTAPNGFFFVNEGANRLTPPGNTGTGLIDKGSVSSFSLWRNALETTNYWNDPQNAGQFQIRFSVDNTTGNTQYQLFDYSDPVYPTAMSAPIDYQDGAKIQLRLEAGFGSNTGVNAQTLDFGAFVVVSGEPAAGDTFQVSPSVNQGMFTTLRSVIDVLKRGIGGEVSATQYTNDLGKQLINLDQALENVSKSRSTVGTSLNELDSLTNTGQDKQLQYSTALSNLQDLDYASAITELSRKQMQLQAAQLSFKQTSQLSLFNVL